jgi:large subunit ribosomal protein L29
MDIKELRALDTHELVLRMEQTRKELMNQRFQMAMGQLTDTSRMRITRRSLARILTILRERELEGAREGSKE